MDGKEGLYRPNVGVALFNAAGLVFAGRSFSAGPEIILPGFEWQMPQGGIDPGEDIVAAAKRELAEETAITSVSLLSVTEEWWRYDFPPYDGPPHRLSIFRGQRQKWFALRFTGDERAIDPLSPRNGQPPEFDTWRWERLDRIAALVVPFRRDIYTAVAAEFAPFARPA